MTATPNLDPTTTPTIPPTTTSPGGGLVEGGVVPYNPRYRAFPLASDLPTSGLIEGELAYTQDDNKLYVATDSTTWTRITTA